MKRLIVILACVVALILLVACAPRLWYTPAEVATMRVILSEASATATRPAYCQPCAATPTPTCPPCPGEATATAPPAATPTPTILWDPRLTDLGLTVERRNGEYELIAAWCTINGNWDDVPDWALAWRADTLGGDHNGYGRIEDAAGNPLAGATLALTWPKVPAYGDTRTTGADGWADLIISGSSPVWNPADGQGPYQLWAYGGDKLVGLGMPGNAHYSFFAVWKRKASLTQMDALGFGR